MANYNTSQEMLDVVMEKFGYDRHSAYVYSFAFLASYVSEEYLRESIDFIKEGN